MNSNQDYQTVSPISLNGITAGGGALLFLGLNWISGGLRWDHVLGAGLFLAGATLKNRGRDLFLFALPLFLMLALYDLQGYIAADLRLRPVELAVPLEFDQAWFGQDLAGERVTPAAWWQAHTHPLLDFIAGLVYLTFVPVFLVTAGWIRFRMGTKKGALGQEARRIAHCLMWGMLLLNVICCATYYVYPAAPPWYLDQYGSGPVHLDAAPSSAGGARFDALLGITFYADYYSRVPNLFGAVPSIHAAFPLFTLYFALRLKSLRVFSFIYFFLICFSAVYLNHHFIFDLIWGGVYALVLAVILDVLSSIRRSVPSPLHETVLPETIS